MRFALSFEHRDWARGGAANATLQLAQEADAAGFDAIWVTEDPDGWDAFALLGAISQRTERIALGTGVTNPYLRHPNLIAASVATLDRLAPGRAFLGLGRGQPEWYEHALGMERGHPVARLEETMRLLRQWWSAGSASIDGEFRVREWKRVVGPTQMPPIYLAAVGPKALEVAGRHADGVLFSLMSTPTYLQRAIATVRTAAFAADRDPAQLRFIADPGIVVTDAPDRFFTSRKRFVANVLALPGMAAVLENPALDVEGIMHRVRAHMRIDELLAAGRAFADFAEHGDVDAAVAEIPDALVAAGSMVGPIDEIRERIRGYSALGVTDLMVSRAGLPRSVDGMAEYLDALRH
ncbi:MAG: LLM class flavin-dependent oxidoreductase [Thermomicrobiales bacterium]